MLNLINYQITEELYNSPKRIVYRGIRILDQQPVILKCFGTTYPTPTEIVRLQHEYEITKHLKLLGIIKPLAMLTEKDYPVLIFEDMGGISLKKYLNNRSLELGEFLKIAIQLAQTLGELHQCGIVHKDIKPSNIILNPKTFAVKLTDFAIASQLTRENASISHPNLLEGSLAYMSPEQTGRMNRSIDYRTDFYSLGVTLYEMLTGQLPYDSEDLMELVHCHIARIPIPPKQVNSQIPQVVSDLIMKLLAKTAEERYQSGFGLKIDLEKCWNQWQEKGKILEFTLANQDFSGQLQIPQKLYGRERELAQLLGAFERVCVSKTEMILVTGYSGIGKSALVQEIQKPLVQHRGYFIFGKFDQFQRNIPFSALVQAFQDLMEQLLSENDDKLKQWKSRILAALGENSQVIIDVIPELERIIERQPTVPQLSGESSQNRFNLLFQKFIKVFTTKETPLAIFIDDLQWADSASIKLIQLLMSEPDSCFLLFIGAYRDNEVNPTHPLALTLEKIRKSGTTVNTISLKSLKILDLNHLIADTLMCPSDMTHPFTKLVYRKTGGNPFFSNQFLKAMYQDRLIFFDFDAGYWQCNLAQIKALAITDNVVEFMAEQLQKLPKKTQEVLKLAACIGNNFDLNTLAIIYQKSAAETANDLWKALQEGLIIPKNEVYKFFQGEVNRNDGQLASQLHLTHYQCSSYKFLHDRVQQAAYLLIPETQKKVTHWQIGRLLLSSTPLEEQEEKIFEIVNQLNLGIDQISTRSERDKLIQLNQFASYKAKLSTAYEPAARYLNLALNLLAEDSWISQYELTMALYLETIEAEYLNTNFEQAERLAATALQFAREVLDRVKIYEKQLLILIAKNQMAEILSTARSALEMLGVNFPEDLGEDEPNTLVTMLQEEMNYHKISQIKELYDLDLMTDPYKLEAMRILMILFAPVLIGYPHLMPLLGFKMVDLCVKYGNSPLATFAYVFYGWLFCGVLGDIEAGYEFGQLGVNLLAKFEISEINCKTEEVFYGFVKHWKDSLESTLDPLLKSLQDAIDVGDLEYAGYSATIYCHNLFFVGRSLNYVIQEQEKYISMMRRNKQEFLIHHTSIIRQLGLQLSSEGNSIKYNLIGESFNEVDMMPVLAENKTVMSIFSVYCCKAILCYLLRNYHQCLENACLADRYVVAVGGMNIYAEHYFYYSLALLAVSNSYVTEETLQKRLEYLHQVDANQQKMKIWATHAPMNYQHKHDLVEAEKLRVLQQNWQAAELYNRAITGAKQQCYLQEEALANELTAEFYQAWGRQEISQTYMKRSHYCYERWGAIAKVKDLESRYPDLITKELDTNLSPSQAIANSTISSSTYHTNLLDLTTVLKASQAIASEIDLDKLLIKLMKIVLENAGSQSGILLLNREDKLLIEAEGIIEPDLILVRQSIPVNESDRLPLSIINYVARTQEDIVLNEASEQGKFTKDSYIVAHEIKSVLCTPILSQGKLIGILYLENNLIAGAFTPERTQLLKLLCSQAAISIENAQLYEAQKEYTKTLERQVRERTQELQQQKAWFDGFFAASSAGFSIMDKELRYVQVNEAIAEINGVPAAEHIGRTLWEVVPQLAPIVEPTYQQILATGEPLLNVEVNGETASQPGIKRHWLVSYFPLPGLDGKPIGVGLVVVEISDRKRVEEALQKAKEAADAASHAKGEFLSKMSHELRTPLNAILGFSQLLNRDSSLTSQQQEYLGIINRAGEHLLTLINDVLEMSKIEAGRIELNQTTFDLYRLLISLKEMFQLRAESKGLKLIFNQALDLPQYVQTDEIKLRQVLINLLGNAIKFTEIGHVTLKVKNPKSQVNNEEISSTHYLNFEIEDTGPGIASEEIDTLFEAFVQTQTGRKSETGTGLGLPISRQFVQLMGGQITVSSILAQGTIFKFDILVKLPKNIEVSTPIITRKVIGLEPNQPHYRILVVEDKSESRLLLVQLLSQVGFEVKEAINGQAAIVLSENWQPHLIWMDMQMPLTNGYEATKQIRATQKQNSATQTIVIALTANAFAEDRAAVLSAGCNDFVSKPFREEDIFDKIAQYLGVRYVYEQPTLPKVEQPIENSLEPELFQGVSAEWISELYQAALELDDERVRQLNEQIRQTHSLLAYTLERLTRKLRFDIIIAVLKGWLI